MQFGQLATERLAQREQEKGEQRHKSVPTGANLAYCSIGAAMEPMRHPSLRILHASSLGRSGLPHLSAREIAKLNWHKGHPSRQLRQRDYEVLHSSAQSRRLAVRASCPRAPTSKGAPSAPSEGESLVVVSGRQCLPAYTLFYCSYSIRVSLTETHITVYYPVN